RDEPAPRDGGPRPARALAPAGRRDRLQLAVAPALVAPLVLPGEGLAAEPQRVGIGAQEALDVRRPREEVPLLVLEGAQILGTDLRLGFDLRDPEPGARARPPQGGADVRHRGAKGTCGRVAALRIGRF